MLSGSVLVTNSLPLTSKSTLHCPPCENWSWTLEILLSCQLAWCEALLQEGHCRTRGLCFLVWCVSLCSCSCSAWSGWGTASGLHLQQALPSGDSCSVGPPAGSPDNSTPPLWVASWRVLLESQRGAQWVQLHPAGALLASQSASLREAPWCFQGSVGGFFLASSSLQRLSELLCPRGPQPHPSQQGLNQPRGWGKALSNLFLGHFALPLVVTVPCICYSCIL